MTKHLKIHLIFFLSITSISISKAQCPKEASLIYKYSKIANTAKNWEEATPASLCKKYYTLVCASKQRKYKINNQFFKRTQQEAKDIEGQIKEIIKKYNNESNHLCGKLAPVKAVYTDSIGIKKENVVGYWISEGYNKNYQKNTYPIFAFFNEGKFLSSALKINNQKSTWKKIEENIYEINMHTYSTYSKKWENSVNGIFKINIQNNTAKYTYKDSYGNSGSSTWYYKGKLYSLYEKNESEYLETTSIHIK